MSVSGVGSLGSSHVAGLKMASGFRMEVRNHFCDNHRQGPRP